MIAASVLLILVAVVLLVVGLAGGSSSLLIVSIAASLLSAVAFVVFARQAAAARAAVGREAGPRSRTVPAGPSPDEPVSPVPHHTSTVDAGGPGWRQPPGPPAAEPYAPDARAYSPPDEPEGRVYFPPDEPEGRAYFPPDEPDARGFPPSDGPDAPSAGDYSSPMGSDVPSAGAHSSPKGPAATPSVAYSPVESEGAPPSAESTPTSPAPGGPLVGDPSAEFLSAGEVARLVRLPDEVRVVDGHPRFHLADCPHLVGRPAESLPVAEAVGLGFTPCAYCAAASTLLTDARPR